ncbi:2,3,4,5-tetrahydropyridine-2,6-dicarboxylate N-succinyltransferase [Buchnera aphidicola]|uniref:2,3,4,5-tetrahydropyridine-2,6-dicarboxylate N-succinyltransferase n=1 Tax=Buchnera aphidicola TaxID=9 RepID=UPI0030EBD8F3
MKEIKKIIEKAWKIKDILTKNEKKKILKYVYKILELVNLGKLRVAEKINNQWKTNQWIKKAILLFLNLEKNKIVKNKNHFSYDKVPLKYENYKKENIKKEKVRIIPGSTVRYGSFINKNTVLMPCFINIGAYVGKGTMIDTWSTIGSCAQIGNNVHISGGVGIGGVLEPLQSNPTIIEDNCFIGARSEIVEGVIVEKGSVISMGVFIGKSTKIYDRTNNTVSYGRVPSGSVVVSGSLPSQDKSHNLYSAIIVKKVDSNTLKKIKINSLLRK